MDFKTFYIINEISDLAIQKAKVKLSSLPNPDKIDVNDYLNRFKILHDKNKIKSIDVMTLTPIQLKTLVQQTEETKSRKEKDVEIKKDAIKVYENDMCIVVKPLTFKASCKYGANTKWCTTSTKHHFAEYSESGGLYYIIPKDRTEKVAVINNAGEYTVYDSKDNDHTIDFIKHFNIPIKIFKDDPIPFDWNSVKGENDINVRNKRLTTLEGAPQEVGGSFYCDNNQLTTLEGAPQEVGGDFYCSENQLTTLEGAPQEVGGGFSCDNNQLTSLEGAPQEVGGGFGCSDNPLTSLEGAPQEVGGDFYCNRNQLTTLEGAPQEVGGGFSCDNNQLTTLEGAPQEVGGGFYCSDNQLTSLEGAPQEVDGDFYCISNPIKFTIEDVKKVCNVKGKIYI